MTSPIDALPSKGEGKPAFTPGPWEYVASTEFHGPYVAGPMSGDICDCYVMSNPSRPSAASGGDSRPIHHQHEYADANARLIAAAPDLYAALSEAAARLERLGDVSTPQLLAARAALSLARGEPSNG